MHDATGDNLECKNIVGGGGYNTATRLISWDITNFPDFWTSQLTFILKINNICLNYLLNLPVACLESFFSEVHQYLQTTE